MAEKTGKNQWAWLVLLIVVCLGIIGFGGMQYVTRLRGNLTDQAVQNVLTVTMQQQQAFDNFVSGDRERLHSFAEYFSNINYISPEDVQRELTLFNEVDAVYSVMCLDDGWFCSNTSTDIRQLNEEDLKTYHSLTGSGVRDTFIGLYSGASRFGYYEAFTFANGHKGLIQKSYDRSKVIETFSLSFYNDQGFAYVVNQRGPKNNQRAGQARYCPHDHAWNAD